MGANSLPRRVAKKVLRPVLGERSYSVLQAIAMGWDIRSGSWYEPELELVPLAVREGETAIDIGANFGLYAYHLSRAVGPRGKVWSFEPVPFTARTFRLVQRGLGFHKNVELVPKGCGEAPGRVAFTVPVTGFGGISAGLVHMGRRDDRPGKEHYASYDTRQIECDVVAIDDFLRDARDVSFVKCDIEGADLFAMRGARRTLERDHPLVVIEITPWYLEGFGLKVADVTGFFDDLGYECFRYDNGTATGSNVRPASSGTRRLIETSPEGIVEDNWVFVHPARRDRVASLLR